MNKMQKKYILLDSKRIGKLDKNVSGFLIESNLDNQSLLNILSGTLAQINKSYELKSLNFSVTQRMVNLSPDQNILNFYKNHLYSTAPMTILGKKFAPKIENEIQSYWAQEIDDLPQSIEIWLKPDNFDWSEYLVILFKNHYEKSITDLISIQQEDFNFEMIVN